MIVSAAAAFIAFMAVMWLLAYADHKEKMAIIAAYQAMIESSQHQNEAPPSSGGEG